MKTVSILEKEISRRTLLQAIGYGAGTIAIAGAVPAVAKDILPSGLVVANAIPTDEEKLRYSGEGVITEYNFSMDSDIQEVMSLNGNREYIPGLMSWDVHIQGMGGLTRDSVGKDGIVINMRDGQRWLISRS